ncbi:mCG1035348 [Mus musculus]|nr:mCG1035348 [Mus musculus]
MSERKKKEKEKEKKKNFDKLRNGEKKPKTVVLLFGQSSHRFKISTVVLDKTITCLLNHLLSPYL